eukprot:14972736-Alexandrium_andersonii.AAC.1
MGGGFRQLQALFSNVSTLVSAEQCLKKRRKAPAGGRFRRCPALLFRIPLSERSSVLMLPKSLRNCL